MTGVLLAADMGWGHHMGDWGAGWWILMVIFWGLVVLGAVWLVRSLASGQRGPGRASALEVLDQRLASGEIDPEEYRERRATLRGDGSP